MNARFVIVRAALAAMVALSVATLQAQMKQPAAGDLGTIKLSSPVMADGQSLAAGTYSVRTSDAAVTPVTGQSPDAEVWVEFVQGGSVKGRELATVLTDAAAVKEVAKSAPPAPGTSRVEMLGGSPYVRVWINHGGKNYLIHLTAANAR
jgi:hypothetical protein